MNHDRCCTEHYHEPPAPLPIDTHCVKCEKPLPANEFFAYGRCEDCWVGDSPTSSYASPKPYRDIFGKGGPLDSGFGYDTGGGEQVQRQLIGKGKVA